MILFVARSQPQNSDKPCSGPPPYTPTDTVTGPTAPPDEGSAQSRSCENRTERKIIHGFFFFLINLEVNFDYLDVKTGYIPRFNYFIGSEIYFVNENIFFFWKILLII